jgi:hypothetical protein
VKISALNASQSLAGMVNTIVKVAKLILKKLVFVLNAVAN